MKNLETHSSPKYLLALILLIVPLTGFVIDIYTPSLPAMTNYFKVDKSLVQLTITVQVIAFGLFHSIFSIWSGRLGQRRILIPGMVLLTLISFLVPFSPNITVLLIFRFLQGAFISIPSAVSKNLVSLHYQGDTLRRYANYLTITWALGPIIAPTIGGYLQHYYGWQAPFLFLAGYSLIALILLYLFLPKKEPVSEKLDNRQLYQVFVGLFKDNSFICISICLSLLYGLLITFNVVGPFLIQKILNYSAVQFGYVAMFMGVAWLLGSMINRFLVRHFTVHSILLTNLAVLASLSLIMLILSWWILNLAFVVLFSFIILCSGAINYPNILGEALSLFRDKASVANGLMGSLNLLGAGLISMIAASIHSESALLLAGMFFGLSLLTAIIYRSFFK